MIKIPISKNLAGKLQTIVQQQVSKASDVPPPVIQSPPLTPEGKPYVFFKDAWVPPESIPVLDPEKLVVLTNEGENTESILQDNSILNEAYEFPLPEALFPKDINAVEAFAELEKQVPGITDHSRLMGQQMWNAFVVFYNHKQVYTPNREGIREIVIEQDFLNWPIRGYITIDSRHEAFERAVDDNYFHIRSDARNEVLIKIWPSTKVTMPSELFEFVIHAIIYDVEDLSSTDITDKSKRLYFWNKKFQMLLEKNMQWCTSLGHRYVSDPCPHPVAHAKDSQRAMIVEEAIASILFHAGLESIIDFGNWEYSKNLILYTFNTNKTIWENIKYLLTLTDRILSWDRAKQKLTLLPMAKYFEKANDNQIEHLYFEDINYEKSEAGPYHAPVTDGSLTKDVKIVPYNIITSYKYSQPAGLDTSRALVSRPVYSHWHLNKQFNVEAAENEIEYAKEQFKTNYVSNLLGSYPVFLLNKTKTDQKAIQPIFSPISSLNINTNDRQIRKVFGLYKILHAGIFLNQTMSVKLNGSTHRITGKFVGIDRKDARNETNYDYALLGQYFVLNVKHILTEDIYLNDLTMVKVNAYKPLNDFEGVK